MTDSRDNQFEDANEGKNEKRGDQASDLGQSGANPADRDGVAAGDTGEPSTSEPEHESEPEE